MYGVLYVQYALFFSDINETSIFSAGLFAIVWTWLKPGLKKLQVPKVLKATLRIQTSVVTASCLLFTIARMIRCLGIFEYFFFTLYPHIYIFTIYIISLKPISLLHYIIYVSIFWQSSVVICHTHTHTRCTRRSNL